MTDQQKIENAVNNNECPSCAIADIHTPATTHSTNPDWASMAVCEECAAEYNSRRQMIPRDEDAE